MLHFISVSALGTQPVRVSIHKDFTWSSMASPAITIMYSFQPAKRKEKKRIWVRLIPYSLQ